MKKEENAQRPTPNAQYRSRNAPLLVQHWTLDVGRWTFLLLFVLVLVPFALADNVVVTNPANKPIPVDVLSNYTSPSVTSAPGTTPSPSPAKVVNIQGNASGIAVPVIPSTATTVVSTALEASHVLKASAGTLVSLHCYNSGSAQFLLIMNSASVPANGAVTLLYPPIAIPAASNVSLTFPVPLTASTGISVSNSSTGTFTKTIGSADCVFTAQVR